MHIEPFVHSMEHISVLHLSVFDSQLRLFITKRDIEWMTGRALMILIPSSSIGNLINSF